jgi:uncharacterized protein YceH (UPF0502 family)
MADELNQPATKGDLATVATELRAEVKALEDRLVEAMRDMQTEMLKAFYSFAETNTQRLAQTEVNESALRGRVETLERRVFELEKRLLPPAA